MKKLANAIGSVIGFILAVCMFGIAALLIFNCMMGLLEIAHWLITGEFFHFVGSEPVSIF